MSGGKIKIVTMAPNMEGAEAFIREFKDDVVISVGHTGADYDCAARAMQEGAHHVTHLYNAMNRWDTGLLELSARQQMIRSVWQS